MTQPTGRRHDPSHRSLLDQITAATSDDEYAEVARRRPEAAQHGGKPLAVVVLTVFGLMLGVSALRTAQNAPHAAQQRAALVEEIHQQQDRLDAQQRQISELRAGNDSLQDEAGVQASRSDRTSSRVEELSFNAGALAVHGPGVRIMAGGGGATAAGGGTVQDTDLQMLVNGLWQAGAEGISINGHRLGPHSAIRTAGSAITVNYISLTEPYEVEAIGDPDTLQARLLESAGGQLWTSLQENFRFRFDIRTVERMSLSANAQEHLLYAKGGN